MRFVAIVLYFLSIAASPCMAKVLDQQSINALFDQYSAVINSRDSDKIKKFLTYYADPTATFYINKITVNAKTRKEEASSSKLNREEYIKYITHIASDPIIYSFVLTLASIEIGADKLNATVSMHINEMAVVSQNKPDAADEKRKIKAIVSTNCNFTVAAAGANPVFTSANCIEKLVFG